MAQPSKSDAADVVNIIETKPTTKTDVEDPVIPLSITTQKLISALSLIKKKQGSEDFTKIVVSQTVTFLGLVYERIRNAIEFREDHLIRRAAIERIFRRRLALNPEGRGEGENILRELLWARYFPNGSLGEHDVNRVQKIIDLYIYFRKHLLVGRNGDTRRYFTEFLVELLTAEIEELLSPESSQIDSDFTYFIFQTLREKVKIEDMNDDIKDTLLFIAIENSFLKSDKAWQRYHLYRLYYQMLSQQTPEEIQSLVSRFPAIFKKIDELIDNQTTDRLTKFTRKQLPPFLILFSILREHRHGATDILSHRNKLWTHVEQTAREKYSLVRTRLNTLAFRSLIYIFITKMMFALILEVPVSKLIYGDVNYAAIGINSLAPPLFMLFIILTVTIPGDDNTKRLFFRIVDIINDDPTFEKSVALITRKAKKKRPVLVAGFTLLYISTFVITLYFIHLVLAELKFNILSESLFVFFISVVAFFAYRVKQLANMYRLAEKPGVLQPLVDFFFMPILSLGKLFSEGVSRLNFFIILFDFIIEAPYKLIIEVIEEWITFVRQKKEEIV